MIGTYDLLNADAKITISEELVIDLKAINANIAEACGLAPRQPVAGKQYVHITDASFEASGYARMIEDNDDKNYYLKGKRLPQSPSDPACSLRANSKCEYTAKSFLLSTKRS